MCDLYSTLTILLVDAGEYFAVADHVDNERLGVASRGQLDLGGHVGQ